MANIKQIVNGNGGFIQSGAIIEFTSDELVMLSNALCTYFKTDEMNETRYKLKDIIHIASQISQYGHMDSWAVSVLSDSVKNNEKAQLN